MTGPDPARPPRPGVLFYCQHSLGIGHLMRSFALCEALAEGFDVQLLCGGRVPDGVARPPGFGVIQLPPIAANLDFTLVSDDTPALGEDGVRATMQRRGRLILEAYERLQPAVVVIELFPFGRKKFAPELLPLLAAARRPPRPAVVCSVRDLLVGRADRQAHDDRASRVLNQYFDAVLVHADPRLARLEETFQPATPLLVPVVHTGYVVRRHAGSPPAGAHPEPGGPRGRGRVLVSAGSGTQGEALLRAAAAAQPTIWSSTGMPMRIVAGPHVRADLWDWLAGSVRDRAGVDLVRVVPDLAPELQRAAVSVSQCGYNTALEVLCAGLPALMVPALDEGDQETARARRLEARGLVRVLHRGDLSPAALAAAVADLQGFRPAAFDLDVAGAQASVTAIRRLIEAKSAPALLAGGANV